MKLGVMDYIVAAGTDLATFACAKQLGLAGVEVDLQRAQLRDTGRARLQQLRQAQAQSGLRIPSLVLGEHSRGGLSSDDTAVVREAIEDLHTALDWAVELGAEVLLVPFFGPAELQSEQQIARAAAGFRELGPLAEQRGVALCYEGTLPAQAVLRMAAQASSPAFGCYFDLANAVSRGLDAATEISLLGGLIRQVHMKDTRAGNCPPGLGLVDFVSSAAALQEIGYDSWLVLETPAAPLPLVARDIAFTRRCFPQIEWAAESWPRIGAFSYDFGRGQLPNLIEAFHTTGLSAVQLGLELLDEALESPEAAAAMRAQLEAAGIVVAGLAGYRNLVAPDEQQRRANIDYIKRCLEYAPLLGTSIVATETGTRNLSSDWQPSPENWGGAAWRLLEQALEELLPVAQQHGSILALEGYVNNILQTHGQLLGLLERFSTPQLQVVLDPYNYLSSHLLPSATRQTEAFFERFEHRFVLAHLKDVGAEGAEIDTPEFGMGVFPQPMYLEFLRTRRPDLALIFEHLPFEHLPAAIQRMKVGA